jgi:hypothetical protein
MRREDAIQMEIMMASGLLPVQHIVVVAARSDGGYNERTNIWKQPVLPCPSGQGCLPVGNFPGWIEVLELLDSGHWQKRSHRAYARGSA